MRTSFFLAVVFALVMLAGVGSALNVSVVDFSGLTNGSTSFTKYTLFNWSILSVNPISTMSLTYNSQNYSLWDDSIVLWYSFNNISLIGENKSYVVDNSKSSNNGTILNLTSGPVYSPSAGLRSGAFTFNGLNNSLGIKLNSTPGIGNSSDFTISVWIYPFNHSHSDLGVIVRYYGYNVIGWRNNQCMGYADYINSTGSTLSTMPAVQTCPANNWTHYVFMRTGSNFSIWINGVYKAASSNTIYQLKKGLTGDDRIGYSATYPQYDGMAFNGSIDDLIILNKSLSAYEVKLLYETQVNRVNATFFNYYVNKSNAATNTLFLRVNDSQGYSNITTSILYYYVNRVTAKFSEVVGAINSHFYGASTLWRFQPTGVTIDTDNDGVKDANQNFTWLEDKLFDANLNLIRKDMNLNAMYSNASNWQINMTGNITNDVNLVNWAHINNVTVLYIVDYMPTFLADNRSGFCTNLAYCNGTNMTYYAALVNHFINNVTGGNTSKLQTIELEFWNEPYIGFLLGKLGTDNETKAYTYTSMFNTVYPLVKAQFPSVEMYAVCSADYAPKFTNISFANITIADGITFHPYVDNYLGSNLKEMYRDVADFKAVCDSYSRPYCNNLTLSEWESTNQNLKNSTSRQQEWMASDASAYVDLLSAFPYAKSIIHQFTDNYKYGVYYPEYPQKYGMVSEPRLDNAVYPPYNVTFMFSRQHSQDDNVVNVTSDYELVKVVASKNGAKCGVTAVNADTDSINISFNTTTSCGTVWMDAQTGALYNASSGTFNYGDLASYGIAYLTTPNLTFTQGTGLVKRNYLGEQIAVGTEIGIASDATAADGLRTVHITSTLPAHNQTMQFAADCATLKSVKLTPKGASKYTPSYTCVGTTLTLYQAKINPSNDSNVLEIQYNIDEQQIRSTCENSSDAIGGMVGKFGLIFMAIVLGGAFYFIVYRTGLMSIGQMILWGLIAIVVLTLTVTVISDLSGTGC